MSDSLVPVLCAEAGILVFLFILALRGIPERAGALLLPLVPVLAVSVWALFFTPAGDVDTPAVACSVSAVLYAVYYTLLTGIALHAELKEEGSL